MKHEIKYYLLGGIGQWISFFTCLSGIIFLIFYGVMLGYILISFASLFWGVSTKIKYYKSRNKKDKYIEKRKKKRLYNDRFESIINKDTGVTELRMKGKDL